MKIRNSNPEGNWRSAHLNQWNFLAAGRSPEDIAEAHRTGVHDGSIKDRPAILGGLGTIGYSVHETPRWLLKGAEIFNKVVGTLAPAIGGVVFLNKAVEVLSHSRDAGETGIGVLMGVIGLAAISIFPVLAYQAGEAYGKMHSWMKDNDMKTGYVGTNMSRRR